MTLKCWWKLCEIALQTTRDETRAVVHAPVAGAGFGMKVGITEEFIAEMHTFPQYPFFRRKDFQKNGDVKVMAENKVDYLAITPNGPVFITDFWLTINRTT